ncbi:MAG: phage tail protein, partial [Sandaracinobacteroides sp.]
MASVLFSTVGQAIGGPLGAGVGAAVGATVDASLFRRARQGASDIYVQRSAYGTIVPKLFGTVRTAGQVVWGLPMANGGQPKGSGRTSTSASFAVALSARPILEIARIWADGREIRSRQGQFENSTQMRLHSAQSLIPDPLIAAFEGVGLTPAFSSLSYVVFEEFDLGPFGNRIPNLSFEIVADRGNASDWLNALAHPVDIATDTSGGVSDVSGYTAGSERLSDDLSTLGVISDAKPGLKGGGLVFCKLPRRFEMDAGDLLVFGTIPGSEPNRTVGNRPTGIAIEYLDSARDYLVSRQQPALVKPGRELSLSLPACASAEAAGSLAAHVLRSAQFGSERLTVGVSWRYLEVTVGDEIRIDGGAWWRVLKRDVRGLEIWLEAERVAEPIGRSGVAADPGRQLSAPLVLATPTILVPFEPPVPIQGTTPCLLVAAAGDEAWR